jgi:hypothetical protein
VLDHDPSCIGELLDKSGAALVLAGAVNHAVADGEHLGMKDFGVGALVAHEIRRYRINAMPSVSWSCGRTRQPWPYGRQSDEGGSVMTSKPLGTG